METVFKLSRAEVELACTQFLAKSGVRLTGTARLAGESSFEHLHFAGEVDLATVAPAALAPAPALDPGGYRAEVERTPVVRAEVVRAVPSSAVHVPSLRALVEPPAASVERSALASSLESPVQPRPRGTAPRFREANIGGSVPVGGDPEAMAAHVGELLSSKPPSVAKIPQSVADFRKRAR